MEDEERKISPEMLKKVAAIIRISEALNNQEVKPVIDLEQTRNEILQENTIQLKKLNEFNEGKKIEGNLENPYESIFLNTKSFKLFDKLHNQYKEEQGKFLANYSFIFYAMQKDGFIICSGIKYIDFLNDNFEITISKVDTRQSGDNIRTATYNAYKDSLLFS